MHNQITTPREFFGHVVTPDCHQCMDSPEDVRLVFHATSSLHHLREWIYKALPDPKPLFSVWCEELYARSANLKTIRDLAVNAKHFPPDHAPQLQIGVSAAPAGWDKGLWDVARWDEATQDQVLSKDTHGNAQWVLPVILDAMHFWSHELT